MRRLQPRDFLQLFMIQGGELFSAVQESGQSLELFDPYGGLNVGHSVVKSRRDILFENDLAGTMPHRIRHAHGVLPQ